jgi:hypothetical protein
MCRNYKASGRQWLLDDRKAEGQKNVSFIPLAAIEPALPNRIRVPIFTTQSNSHHL